MNKRKSKSWFLQNLNFLLFPKSENNITPGVLGLTFCLKVILYYCQVPVLPSLCLQLWQRILPEGSFPRGPQEPGHQRHLCQWWRHSQPQWWRHSQPQWWRHRQPQWWRHSQPQWWSHRQPRWWRHSQPQRWRHGAKWWRHRHAQWWRHSEAHSGATKCRPQYSVRLPAGPAGWGSGCDQSDRPVGRRIHRLRCWLSAGSLCCWL